MLTNSKKLLERIGIGLFVLIVGWGTLLLIEAADNRLSTEPIDLTIVPEPLQLRSEPQDVIFAETKETPDGVGEVKYAYLKDEVPPEDKEDITRRTPVSQTEVLEVTQEGNERIEKVKTTFFAKPQFYESDNNEWRQIEYATTTPEAFSMSGAIPHIKKREFVEWLLPGKPVFALTSTFYPNPNVETVSVDGWVSYDSFSLGNSSYDSGTTINVESDATYFDGTDCFCYMKYFSRGVLLFDTSSLTASAEVTGATLSIYVTARNNSDNDGSDYIGVFTSNPSSNTALVGSDYSSVGGTNFASPSPDITALTLNTYTNINLNSSGLISTTGITKLALKEGHNAGALIANGTVNSITVSSAEVSGTSQDPKLVVTYTTGSFSMGQWFPF